MGLLKRLLLLQQRNLINYQIVTVTLDIQALLRYKWQVNTDTPQVETLLLHLANALGRINRGYCAQPLNAAIFAEIESAVCFPLVLDLHQQILRRLPISIPYNEQTHFIANIYSLMLDQPHLLSLHIK